MFDKLLNIHSSAWAMFAVMLSWILLSFLSLPEAVQWTCKFIILFVLYRNLRRTDYKKIIDKAGFVLLIIFIAWLFIGFFRACHYAQGYWMWKMVMNQFFMSFFYIVVLIAANAMIVRDYFRLYFLLFIPMVLLSFIVFRIPQGINYMPFMAMMLFFMFIPKRKRWMLLAIALVYLVTFEHRNDIIKLLVAVSIGMIITFFYNIISVGLIRVLHIVLLVLPLVLLFLGILGVFNVFKMDEYIKGDYSLSVKSKEGEGKRDLKADTRTSLYVNVFYTLNKYDALVYGRSPAFGDEGWTGGETDVSTGLKGRYGNEVGFLDILLWYGVVGVAIYFLLFVRASYLAIYQSRNRIAKGVGLYTAYLWFMFFIWEKPMFETFFMMDLVLIGLCLSKPFRQMTDSQMRLWVRSIFLNRKKNSRNENSVDIKRPVSRSL